jgi:8-oxo-dGTP diphosphatase
MQKQIEFIARGFIFQNGKVLLCKRKDRDYYFFPGGHIEFGEFVEDALKREIKEEIDAEVTKCNFIGIAENIFKDGEDEHHEINFTFQAEIDREDVKALEDYLEFRWLDYNDFLKEKVLPTSLKEEIIKWEKDKPPHPRATTAGIGVDCASRLFTNCGCGGEKIFWSSQNDLK